MESEFLAAVAGAVVGSTSSGVIAWWIQRGIFKRDTTDRKREKDDKDRALLLQVFYATLQAVSDLQKFAEDAGSARLRARAMAHPKVHGLSNLWSAMNYPATLPEPIAVNPEAITVFMDKQDPDLAMEVLDMVAVHRSSIELWAVFADSRRRIAEKLPVKFDAETTYTPMSKEDIERHYPHLKELTDLAEGIDTSMGRHHVRTAAVLKRLQKFIAEHTGYSITYVAPGDPGYVLAE